MWGVEVESFKLNILSQSYYSDNVSKLLVEYLEQTELDLTGANLYYEFPVIRELDEDMVFPTFMLVSPYYGVLLILADSINRERSNEINDLSEKILRIEQLIFSKLIKSTNKKLKSGRRNLSFNLSSILFLPHLEEVLDGEVDIDIVTDKSKLETVIESFEQEELEFEIMNEIYSILDSSSGIIKPKERIVPEEGGVVSKATILKKLEEEIAVFDAQQKYAALSQLNGPQRIRGLAGSGKTIILCMKAALIHLKYPEKKILYTFMTKSLYDYIELLITRFYKVLGDGMLPDFKNNIHIMHAWGGANINGVYYNVCKKNNISPITFAQAANRVGRGDAFDYICTQALAEKEGDFIKEYDYVFIDEGQDFKPSFYQICRAIVKDDCLVWGYDDLQNIFDVSMQNTIDTFKNEYGAEGIDLVEIQKNHPHMDNDIVLHKSYRNPKEILVTAHALGFGIYNDILIQTLENKEHWEDVGYKVEGEEIIPEQEVIIQRPLENSPLSIANYCPVEEIIKYYSATDLSNEVEWVASEIEKAINEDGLRPDDIIVISLDDRYNKGYFRELTDVLYSKGIYTNNLSANTYATIFSEDNLVTLSTVYKAKGHEAAMVFVIGCDVFESQKNDRVMRNKLFTAFTRAKAWLRVSGFNIEGTALINEMRAVKENEYKLIFKHKEAHIIKRDLNEAHIRKADLRKQYAIFIQKLKEQGYSEKEIEQQWFLKDNGETYE